MYHTLNPQSPPPLEPIPQIDGGLLLCSLRKYKTTSHKTASQSLKTASQNKDRPHTHSHAATQTMGCNTSRTMKTPNDVVEEANSLQPIVPTCHILQRTANPQAEASASVKTFPNQTGIDNVMRGGSESHKAESPSSNTTAAEPEQSTAPNFAPFEPLPLATTATKPSTDFLTNTSQQLLKASEGRQCHPNSF